MQTSYRPELDVSLELEPIEAAYYQSLIGILRWMVELGRVEVFLECLMPHGPIKRGTPQSIVSHFFISVEISKHRTGF